MLFKLPILKRCCCWLPLRLGILTFAYLNLVFTIIFTITQIIVWAEFLDKTMKTVPMYRGIVGEVQMYFALVVNLLDIIFNIILVVGAHKKNLRLMRIYYYYLMTMIANYVVLLFTYSYSSSTWVVIACKLAVAFIGLVLQVYLLILIHSELKKQRYQKGRSSFINHISEVCLELPLSQDK